MSQSFEDSVVSSDLKYWGFRKGLQYAAEGYPAMNTLTQILSGRSEKPGHRILCLDMPARAWQINAKIYSLPMELIQVLTCRYCLPCKEDGQPYSNHEMARFLGISSWLFSDRLGRARADYKSIVFPDLVVSRRRA